MTNDLCLILGGCGFMGSHLADALITEGYRVRLFDKLNVDTRNVERFLPHVELYTGDFTNSSDIRAAVKGVTCIFHLVSTTLPSSSNQNRSFDLQTNVAATLRLLDEAVSAGVQKVVFSSSGGTVYGIPDQVPIPETAPTQPICSYGITKLAIEKYLALYHYLYDLDYTCLRIANPYGERQNPEGAQGAVAVFLGRVIQKKPIIIWGDGSVVRDYLYVSDVTNAFMRAMRNTSDERVFNIGSGCGTSLNDLLDVIADVSGGGIDVRYEAPRKLDVPVNILDVSLVRKKLGWGPEVSMQEGVSRTWEWLQNINQDG